MTDAPLNVLFTWRPDRDLEKFEQSVPGVRITATASRDEALRLLPDADVLCVGDFDAEMLSAAPHLRWVQALMGGVESVLFPEFVSSPIPLTCCKECFAVPAAEHALALMLAFSRRVEYDIRRRPHRTYEYRDPEELQGKTAGIIGTGNIGREIAHRCRSFGMRVLGGARQARQSSEFDEILSAERLPELLGRSDFVIVAAPLTSETVGMIGEAALERMKPSAYLVDISGRPALYDLGALESALQQKRIAGAALQIVPPDSSSLWDLDNLLISFHRTTSPQEVDRCFDLFAQNLSRFRLGQPLRGLVDKQAGY
jgi:phosphoglycerate dehydrogenase-like enzyme